jgi:hypothetical protein
MKLIVIPGAADPKTSYKEVYDLLEEEATRRSFTKFIVKNYPGHYSYDDNSYLSVAETVNIIRSAILELEEKKESYIVLCRSFGCLPFVEFLKSYPENIVFLKKVVLWGVSPYYLWYKNFFKEFDPKVFKDRNVRVKRELFDEIYPVELSIDEISKNLNFKIYITSGDQDHHHPVHFQTLLKTMNQNPTIVLSDMIEGEGHAITKKNESYFNLIFQ